MTKQDIQAQKTAETIHPVSELIRKRWSPRSFDVNRAIAENDLQTLFEAASWAPSSMNEQPWRYIYAHRSDEANFKRLFDCLAEGNQPWAKNAAVLVVSLARKKFVRNDKPNRHALYDTGGANALLTLQALELGIYVHQMGGFDFEKTAVEFSLPEEVEVACFLALGYLDSPDKLEEPFKTRELGERTRRPLADTLQKI